LWVCRYALYAQKGVPKGAVCPRIVKKGRTETLQKKGAVVYGKHGDKGERRTLISRSLWLGRGKKAPSGEKKDD